MFEDCDFIHVRGSNYRAFNGVSYDIRDFYVCKHQVSQQEFESVAGFNNSKFTGLSRPVECVTWYEAIEFCNKLSFISGLDECYTKDSYGLILCDFLKNGYRLPRECEWEFAARGGVLSKGYKYFSGSDDIDEVGWCYMGDYKGTRDIMLKKPNELGVYDMTGNVWEYCWEWFKTAEDCISDEEKYMCRKKVTRGGSWGDYPEGCKYDFRGIHDPESGNCATGFRLFRNFI